MKDIKLYCCSNLGRKTGTSMGDAGTATAIYTDITLHSQTKKLNYTAVADNIFFYTVANMTITDTRLHTLLPSRWLEGGHAACQLILCNLPLSLSLLSLTLTLINNTRQPMCYLLS